MNLPPAAVQKTEWDSIRVDIISDALSTYPERGLAGRNGVILLKISEQLDELIQLLKENK